MSSFNKTDPNTTLLQLTVIDTLEDRCIVTKHRLEEVSVCPANLKKKKFAL